MSREFFKQIGIASEFNFDSLTQLAGTGNAQVQSESGVRVLSGHGMSTDVRSAAQESKIAGYQGVAQAQCMYGIWLQNGEGVSIDLRSAVHSIKQL
jgi:TPR repeat protein